MIEWRWKPTTASGSQACISSARTPEKRTRRSRCSLRTIESGAKKPSTSPARGSRARARPGTSDSMSVGRNTSANGSWARRSLYDGAVPSAKELMRAGELYPGDDPELNRELDQRQALVSALNAIPYERSEERAAALAGLLAAIGEETFVRTPFYCDYGDGIRI